MWSTQRGYFRRCTYISSTFPPKALDRYGAFNISLVTDLPLLRKIRTSRNDRRSGDGLCPLRPHAGRDCDCGGEKVKWKQSKLGGGIMGKTKIELPKEKNSRVLQEESYPEVITLWLCSSRRFQAGQRY